MSDPLTTDAAAADALEGRERDARVEQLLLVGLDRYFSGDYEQAIHVWTRVLFLDRGHARARAYIDRARSAQAERQRESDELLHRGTKAFEDGKADAARDLLNAAVAQGAHQDVALAYLGRLDRLTTVGGAADVTAPATAGDADAGSPSRPERRPAARSRLWLLGAAGIAGVLCCLWAAGVIVDISGWTPSVSRPVPVASPNADPLPVPLASDVALAQASLAFSKGHARDALRLLASIPLGDPNRGEADRLLADVQRVLLASADPANLETVSTVR
jgi:hypothetical protein